MYGDSRMRHLHVSADEMSVRGEIEIVIFINAPREYRKATYRRRAENRQPADLKHRNITEISYRSSCARDDAST